MIRAILTIDDVSSANTPALVDYLIEKKIPALLFAVGENVEKYYEEALYAVREGMTLGNHSYSHGHFSAMPPEAGCTDIARCEAVLNKLYQDAGVKRMARPFRFPYGDRGGQYQAAYQQYLAENGFHKLRDSHITFPWWQETGLDKAICTHWTYDFEEYRIRPGADFTWDDVLKKMDAPAPEYGGALRDESSGHILLMHAHDETERLAPRYYRKILDRLLDVGAIFEPPAFFSAQNEKGSIG